MRFQPADPLSVALFVLFSIFMYILIHRTFSRVDRFVFQKPRLIGPLHVGFLLFFVLFSVVVVSGVLERQPVPFLPLLFVSILGLSIWFSFSKFGSAVGSVVSLPILIAFQGFRLPLELILHRWAQIGTVPGTMTWTGQNWDIVSGCLALVFAPFVARNPRVAWIPTVIGFVLLLNVLRVVVMSSPLPFSWPLENPIQLAMHLPYAWIAPLFVAPALIVHLISIRQLLK